MALGSMIRRMFGPYERQIGELYRSIYIDLDAFVAMVQHWCPHPKRILEVGCGEGSMTERLVVAFPGATLTPIDITPRIGRMYSNLLPQLKFNRCTIQEVAATEPHSYDLVILSDVLHHVPPIHRRDMLDSVRVVLADQGTLVFKDWERNVSPIHFLGYASDRWLTGDRISYMSRDEMRDILVRSFGENSLIAEARVEPRWNNLATLVRPS
jgi:ubiquinone/menaquinone biosynthesis C-methylase UbiE